MALVYPEDISVKPPDEALSQYALNNWSANGDPSVNDDTTDGYEVGSFWFKVIYPFGFWICLDPAEGAAVWTEVTVERNHMWVLATAGENLAAQDNVNLYSDAGTLKVRKADADDTTKPCDGFVSYAATSGNPVYVITASAIVRTGLSGLTVGDDLYLSTTAGALTATAPSTSGNGLQRLGRALSSTTMLFDRGEMSEVGAGGGGGGGDMLAANNLSDLVSASTARTNLGLGTVATQDSTALDGTFAFDAFKLQQETTGFVLTASAEGDDYTADRRLSIVTGDSDRTLTLTGNATVSGTNTGDQTLNGLLPSQTGNNGKVLQTDGSNASWETPSGGGLTHGEVLVRSFLGC